MATEALDHKFLHKSPDALKDAQLLELLLRFSTDAPEKLAKQLLAQYANIANLMEADTADLSAVEGIDEKSLLLLRLVPELHRRYFLTRAGQNSRLMEPQDYGRFLLPYFYGERDEVVYLLMLDAACKVINCRKLGTGSVNSANVPVRKLVQEAINANATAIVLAHNHPSGIAIPSKEDIEITLRISEALRVLDLPLLDHIIVADDDFVSLRESGYLYP